MIALDRVAEVTIALLIALVFFVIVLSVFMDGMIETVKEKINRLSVDCSDLPSLNASEINFNGSMVYCVVGEKT